MYQQKKDRCDLAVNTKKKIYQKKNGMTPKKDIEQHKKNVRHRISSGMCSTCYNYGPKAVKLCPSSMVKSLYFKTK